MDQKILCIYCGGLDPKYKCPTCYSKFCSVRCCQGHKLDGTCKSVPVTYPNSSRDISTTSRCHSMPNHPDMSAAFTRLKECIKDPVLQEWIRKLDLDCNFYEKRRTYIEAMEYPIFVEYAQLITILKSPYSSESTNTQ